MSVRLTLAVLLIFAGGSVAALSAEPALTPPSNQPAVAPAEPANPRSDNRAAQIEQLIQQLGDEKFEVREAASRGLAALGQRARAALEQATKSDDAEVASRAR